MATVLGIESLQGQLKGPLQRFALVAIVIYVLASGSYLWSLVRRRTLASVHLPAIFLALDPAMVVLALAGDPEVFAILSPFVIVVVVRAGMRYGVSAMYVSWVVAVVCAVALIGIEYWRSASLVLSTLLVMLAFIPLFFESIIRQIHAVRRVEEARARAALMHTIAVSRSVFLSRVSHELRSTLQSIVSAVDLFQKYHGYNVDARDDAVVNRLQRASGLMKSQLRDLKTLADGEAGRIEVHPEPFEAVTLIETIAENARHLAAARGLVLEVDVPPESAFVVADGPRIDQIVTNLVANAIRYTDQGHVRLVLAPFDVSPQRMRIRVVDTGRGLPKAVMRRLLDPHSEPAGVESSGGGSGLGLAVVRTLIDRLDGQLAVTSREHEGTTFTVEVPVEPADDIAAAEVAVGEMAGRVLVVDDRNDVLDGVSSVVDELGFECDQATSASGATSFVTTRRYDSILIDVDMPGSSGLAVAREIRDRVGPNRNARLIGMSARDVDAETRDVFDAFLGKPIDSTSLRRALLTGLPAERPSQPGLWSDEPEFAGR